MITLWTSVGAFAQIKQVDIQATGLTCSMCSNAINKQLLSLPEVAEVTTDLNTNTFTVLFKKNAVIRPVTLKNAVEKAGFFVGVMNLTLDVDMDKIDARSTLKTKAGSFVFIDHEVAAPKNQYRVLDRGFVTQREYRKLAESYASHPSFLKENENEYHLIAVK